MFEIFYILLGCLLTISCQYLWKKHKEGMTNVALAVGVTIVCLGAFALAFIAASLGEKEPQAAGMAAMIFGGITIVLGIWFKKMIDKTSVSS